MKIRIKKNLLLGVLCGVVWCWTAPGWAGFPLLKVAEPLYDFGELQEGEVVSHDFTVMNTGVETLQIQDVRPG